MLEDLRSQYLASLRLLVQRQREFTDHVAPYLSEDGIEKLLVGSPSWKELESLYEELDRAHVDYLRCQQAYFDAEATGG